VPRPDAGAARKPCRAPPRLRALGADLDRVFVFCPEDAAPGEVPSLPGRAGALEQALAQTRARLVVIDPVMAFLDRHVLTASDQSVRRALAPLVRLAQRYGCAVLLVRHLTKGLRGRALYRGGGSIGMLAACRSAWLAAPDPHDPQRRVLAQVKNNLAPPQPSLAYTLQAQEGAPPSLCWLGPSLWTADQLVAGPAPAAASPRPRDRAAEFLSDVLKDSPRTSRDLLAAARQGGLTEHTLRRAKRELEIRSLPVWAGGQRLSYWPLPGQRLPDTIAPEDAEPDLEEWLAPLRARFPPSTPLDDMD
jgi:hypothetical protein